MGERQTSSISDSPLAKAPDSTSKPVSPPDSSGAEDTDSDSDSISDEELGPNSEVSEEELQARIERQRKLEAAIAAAEREAAEVRAC